MGAVGRAVSKARQGKAGKSMQGKARQVRQGKARQGKSMQGKARTGDVEGEARCLSCLAAPGLGARKSLQDSRHGGHLVWGQVAPVGTSASPRLPAI